MTLVLSEEQLSRMLAALQCAASMTRISGNETAVDFLHALAQTLKDGDTKGIVVWAWDDAPAEYKALSPHGGDEDWVALIPGHLRGEDIGWMQQGTSFGCCDVSVHPLADGREIRIGAHA